MRPFTILMLVMAVILPMCLGTSAHARTTMGQTMMTIGVFVDDEQHLPSDLLREIERESVTVETAETTAIHAVLISGEKLSELAQDVNQRTKLVKLLRKKPLVAYNMSPTDMARHLQVSVPQVTSHDQKYLVGSIKYFGQGGSISGGVFVHTDDRAVAVQEVAQDIRAHLHEVQQLLARYQYRPAAYLRSPNITTNYINECPLGKLNENAIANKVVDDGSSVYDFWTVELETQTVAGVSTCSGSDWRIVGLRSWNRLTNSGALLYKYGPTTSNPDTSVTVDVGFTAGYNEASFNLGRSWSWSLPSVSVTDTSDFSTRSASWQLRYNYYSAAATNTFLAEPGFSARIPHNAAFTVDTTRYMNVDAPWYIGESTSPQRFLGYRWNP